MAQDFQCARKSGADIATIEISTGAASAISAGQIVAKNGFIAAPRTPIVASSSGTLVIGEQENIVKVSGALNQGVAVFWDDNANPKGGTAGTGALTATSAAGPYLGITTAAAAATDEFASVQRILPALPPEA